jgi:hypothetical protein
VGHKERLIRNMKHNFDSIGIMRASKLRIGYLGGIQL